MTEEELVVGVGSLGVLFEKEDGGLDIFWIDTDYYSLGVVFSWVMVMSRLAQLLLLRYATAYPAKSPCIDTSFYFFSHTNQQANQLPIPGTIARIKYQLAHWW